MKKLLLVFSAFALVLSSCSKSEDAPIVVNPDPVVVVPPVVDPSGIFLTKTISTGTNGIPITKNYTYNGKKLVSIISTNTEGYSAIFTYSGDLITQIEEFIGMALYKKETFNYDSSNRLYSYVIVSNGSGSKSDFTYLANGDISSVNYKGTNTSQTIKVSTSKVFFTNGTITKKETNVIESEFGPAYSYISNYTYDNKNFPLMNVTGYNKIAFANDIKAFTHNIKTWEGNSALSILNNFLYVFSYTYNSSDFPITESSRKTNGSESSTVITEYFY